jgi:hypothetical protein
MEPCLPLPHHDGPELQHTLRAACRAVLSIVLHAAGSLCIKVRVVRVWYRCPVHLVCTQRAINFAAQPPAHRHGGGLRWHHLAKETVEVICGVDITV